MALADQLKQCAKLLMFLMAHKDAGALAGAGRARALPRRPPPAPRRRPLASAGPPTPHSPRLAPPPRPPGPFLEPVNWKEWGLLDYPKVIKTPMDLGTVRTRLESGAYASPKEFRHDTNLVWTNCMTYNADGSEFYLLANSLKKVFDEKYAKIIREDDELMDLARPATLVDKKMFAQNIYNISAEDLGKVVQLLDQRCEVRLFFSRAVAGAHGRARGRLNDENHRLLTESL